MRKGGGGGSPNGFKLGTFIGRFPNDGTASMAVKGLNKILDFSFYDILPLKIWKKVPESDARSVSSTRTFRRALTASLDSCAEVKSAPSVA